MFKTKILRNFSLVVVLALIGVLCLGLAGHEAFADGSSGCATSDRELISTTQVQEYRNSDTKCTYSHTVDKLGNVWSLIDNGLSDDVTTSGVLQKRTPSGVITDYPLNAGVTPALLGGSLSTQNIVVDNSGNIWFSELTSGQDSFISKLVEFSPVSGTVVHSYDMGATGTYLPIGVDMNSNGLIWFTLYDIDSSNTRVGYLDTKTGQLQTDITPATSEGYMPSGMAVAPDGTLWLTDYNDGSSSDLVSVTLDGVSHAYSLDGATLVSGNPITIDDSGNIWLTILDYDTFDGFIEKRSAIDGSLLHKYPLPSASMLANNLIIGSDGNLWFNEGDLVNGTSDSRIGVLDPVTGATTDYDVMSIAYGMPVSLASDNRGNIWFSEVGSNSSASNIIGRFTMPTYHTTQSPKGDNIAITSPVGTIITCSNISTAPTSTPDKTYTYPLGLVNYCLTVPSGSSQTISLVFPTNLKPNQVTPRKYNPTTKQYSNLPSSANATITETTLNGNHALKLTYTIEDNGELDDDPTLGSIKDPIGLATTASTTTNTTNSNPTNSSSSESGGLAETGMDIYVIAGIGMLSVLVAGAGLVWSRKYVGSGAYRR